MSDDRDRRAAEEWWDGFDVFSSKEDVTESLAAFRAAARAEGAAEAISRLRDYAMECGDEDQRATLLRAADELEMERAAAIARLEARIK